MNIEKNTKENIIILSGWYAAMDMTIDLSRSSFVCTPVISMQVEKQESEDVLTMVKDAVSASLYRTASGLIVSEPAESGLSKEEQNTLIELLSKASKHKEKGFLGSCRRVEGEFILNKINEEDEQ